MHSTSRDGPGHAFFSVMLVAMEQKSNATDADPCCYLRGYQQSCGDRRRLRPGSRLRPHATDASCASLAIRSRRQQDRFDRVDPAETVCRVRVHISAAPLAWRQQVHAKVSSQTNNGWIGEATSKLGSVTESSPSRSYRVDERKKSSYRCPEQITHRRAPLLPAHAANGRLQQ